MTTQASRTLIIAEIGVNHNGDLERAKSLATIALEAGADIAKFQVFSATSLSIKASPLAEYQKINLRRETSQFEMLQKLELSPKAYMEVAEHCRRIGIEFMASGFSLQDLDFIDSLGVKRLKVPSGEMTNLPYLRHIAKMGKPVILSTGMATLSEIAASLGVLEQGLRREDIVVLHCTTDYPTDVNDVNLAAMLTIKSQFGVSVGYSDHTEGVLAAPAAVAMGAIVIEKHLTLSRDLDGPDHSASLEPGDFRQMVESCRYVERAIGSPEKTPTQVELENQLVARKSVVASRAIARGEIISETDITTKRPGTGLSPMLWDDIVGSPAVKDFLPEDFIEL